MRVAFEGFESSLVALTVLGLEKHVQNISKPTPHLYHNQLEQKYDLHIPPTPTGINSEFGYKTVIHSAIPISYVTLKV